MATEIEMLIRARNEAEAALKSVQGDLKQIDAASKSVGQSFKDAGKDIAKLGVGLSASVTAPVVALGGAAVMSAADFEQSMNVLAQVTGASTSAMAQMQAQALQLGAETSFSAGEAAAAMLELGKAGLDTVQISESIGGVLDLAAAGNLGLAQAAEIAANAVNAFGLDASQSTQVANMLAAAANASSVDVTDLAAAMKMSGTVFASNGQSIEDMTVALSLLGNNALKGSDAGTSLKTMLMRLTAPTAEAATMMKDLGVQVYDAQGSMLPLPAIMEQMQQALFGTNAVQVTSSNLTKEQADRMAYLKGTIGETQRKLADYQAGIAGVAQSEADKVVAVDRLNRVLNAAQAEYAQLAGVGGTTSTVMRTLTEEQRNAALSTIFGTDAIRAANILLASGAEQWDAMSAAVGKEGAAAELANARMSGVNGAVEYFKGTLESTLIEAVLPYMDGISRLIRQAADFIGMFTRIPANIRGVILGMAAAAAAIGPLLIGIGMVTSAIGSAMPVISAIGSALALLSNPIGWVVAGLAALGAAWATNFLGIRDLAAPAVAALTAAFQGAVVTIQTLLLPAFQELGKWWDLLAKGDWSGLEGAIGDTLERIRVTIANFKWSDFITALSDWSVYVGKLTWDTFVTALANWGQWIVSLPWGDYVTKLSDWGLYIVKLVWGEFVTSVSNWGTWISDLSWGDYVTALSDWSVYVGKLAWDGFVTALDDWGTWISSLPWGDYVTALSDWSVYVGKLAWNAFVSAFPGWGQWINRLDWNRYVSPLVWNTYVYGPTPTAWDRALGRVQWASFLAPLSWNVVVPTVVWSQYIAPVQLEQWITSLDWAAFINALSWDTYISLWEPDNWDSKVPTVNWSAFITPAAAELWNQVVPQLDWGAYVTAWVWPTLARFAWGDWIDKFKWPTLPQFAWRDWIPKFEWPDLPDFGSWADYVFDWFRRSGAPSGAATGAGNPYVPPTTGGTSLPIDVTAPYPEYTGNRQLGTNYFAGGLTWVGELGPELVSLPRGAAVIPNREATAVAGAAAGNWTFNLYGNVRGEDDLLRLAYEVADIIGRRR